MKSLVVALLVLCAAAAWWTLAPPPRPGPGSGSPALEDVMGRAALGAAEQAAEHVKRELGALASRPEAGEQVARRLIQALVTDTPSVDYVRAVARVFDDNGHGQRGDMRAVVHAMLAHPEAAEAARRAGSLKEPLMRAAAALLAQPARPADAASGGSAASAASAPVTPAR
ncbi:MAG: DUF1800 family protein [Rubrivivax sp.]